jgi:hypothetical protein
MVTTGFGVESTGLDVENPKRGSIRQCLRAVSWSSGYRHSLLPNDPVRQIGLGSDPIIGRPYAACAKETIHEGGRETRVGFCSDVALLCQVPA